MEGKPHFLYDNNPNKRTYMCNVHYTVKKGRRTGGILGIIRFLISHEAYYHKAFFFNSVLN